MPRRTIKQSSRQRKEEKIQIRMTAEQRGILQTAADREALDLSTWIRMVALKAAK